MSFKLTTEQVRDQTKDVTRRLGWWFLKPGDILNACVQCQGLKKGEKVEKICQIMVVERFGVPLSMIRLHPSECAREGFPDMTPDEFIEMFCLHHKCGEHKDVNRIVFKYI